MFRNQYDNDVTVWSPQGRIHQIEYAMEAVKQGSATVGMIDYSFRFFKLGFDNNNGDGTKMIQRVMKMVKILFVKMKMILMIMMTNMMKVMMVTK